MIVRVQYRATITPDFIKEVHVTDEEYNEIKDLSENGLQEWLEDHKMEELLDVTLGDAAILNEVTLTEIEKVQFNEKENS
jgi:hypothetical protein